MRNIVSEDVKSATRSALSKASDYKRQMQEAVPMANPPAIVQPIKAPQKMVQGPSSSWMSPKTASTQATAKFMGNAPKPGISQVTPSMPKAAVQPPAGITQAASTASKGSGMLGSIGRSIPGIAGAAAIGAAASTAARDAAFASPEIRQMGKDLYKNSPTARAVSDTMLKVREKIGLGSTAPKEFQRTSASSTPASAQSTPDTSTKPSAATKIAKSGKYFSGSPNVSKGDYTIKKGETLSGIAKAKGTSVAAIQSMNKGLTDVNKIAAGGKLNLPTSTGASAPKASTPTPAPETKPLQNPDQNITKQVPTVKAPESPAKVTPPASSTPTPTPAPAPAPANPPTVGASGASIGGGIGGQGGQAGSGPGAGSGGSGGAGVGPGSRGGKGGKGGDTLGESVQIGLNRYRII